ncbi:hypothetical protein FRC06_007318 [Ceratobasidium sp. 370]|nr:hypothetical protein FRC06_007318 [Ceratobasidium sp. 370]
MWAMTEHETRVTHTLSMPAEKRKKPGTMHCPVCKEEMTRKAVRRHARFSCTPAQRERDKVMRHIDAVLDPTLARREDLPRPRRRRRCRRQPLREASPSRPESPPDDSLPAQDPRHPDFLLDTPGAGPSDQAQVPPRAFHSPPVTVEEVEDEPPITLADLPGWPRGLTAEDVLDQELVAELMRDGGFQLPDEDGLLVEGFNYKVDTKITGRAFSKLPRAFPGRLGDLPTEERIRTRVATLAGIQGVFLDCCINSCMAYTGTYKRFDKCLYCGEARYKPNPDRPGQVKARLS